MKLNIELTDDDNIEITCPNCESTLTHDQIPKWFECANCHYTYTIFEYESLDTA